MDEIDLSILRYMQKDARVSIKELSKKINLSQPATSERIKKLERSGAIEGYITLINPSLSKNTLTCFCLLVLKKQNAEPEFYDYIQNHSDIAECFSIAGAHEFIIKIVTESSETLGSILEDLRVTFNAKTSTYPVLITYKNQSLEN